eukprot:2813097-Amphidinium_carterae.2
MIKGSLTKRYSWAQLIFLEINDRVDGVEKHQANVSKETTKRLNAVDLRISGLQGASGEAKRDINKLRDE